MKSLIFLFFGFLLLTACGPSSNFSSDDVQFKSLMDGETVEVVTDDELVDSLEGRDPSDGDNNNESDSGAGDDSADEGVYSCEDCEESVVDDDGGFMGIVRGEGRRRGHGNREGRAGGMTCRDRVMDQVNRGRSDEAKTSPEEIEIDRELYEAIKCVKGKGHVKEGHSKGSGYGLRKVYICHFPNGDYAKRKTKCLPIPAIQAFLDKQNNQPNRTGHLNYAGPCKDLEDENSDDDSSSDDEGSEVEDSDD